MFTEPEITTSEDLKIRSYITFYFNGERKREYNGKNIDKPIHPNKAKTVVERKNLLKRLQFEFLFALENGCYPAEKLIVKEHLLPIRVDAKTLLLEAMNKKLSPNLSKTYKRDLHTIYIQFTTFLNEKELNGDIADISSERIEEFLSKFNSSGTYYMNKRRNLGVLFASISRATKQTLTASKETERKKSKAKLHLKYDSHQLNPILNNLKVNYPQLYLCCLLTYGSWLRPHEEVRLLTKGHFKNDYSEIHLSGSENKGGKVRVVYVPDYIQKVLLPILPKLDFNDNIFTHKPRPFNEAYFNTQWTRAWKKMFIEGIIYKNQTIYSFRHTAAVEVFKRTKDIYLLQKLLGHSTIVVTLKYLRGLGEFNSEELKDAAPTLDF
jgi:integrase